MTRFLRALAALLALLSLFATPAVARTAPDSAAQAVRPALWEIAGPGSTIYLFGTIHLLPAGVRWFDGGVAQAFARSDTLVTEIVEPDAEAMRAILTRRAMLPAGPSLRDSLSPAQRRRLEAALAASALPVAALDRLQPWYAAITLATTPLVRLGYDPADGVDARLGARAQAAGIAHEALETADYQLGLFAALPPAVQRAYLMAVVRQLPGVRQELAAIIRAWEQGDAARLARLMNDDEDDPRMMQVLLTDRNVAWAKWIAARLRLPAKPHETLFIAVGAGHLAGPGSVVDQLRALGIASRRVQ